MNNRILLLVTILCFVSCGTKDRQIENYGDITLSEGGIVLSNINEHRGGWQRNECLLCHNINLNVHRSAHSNLDPEELNQKVRENEGSKYCLTCHGANGVQ
jgi:hypothetical protein